MGDAAADLETSVRFALDADVGQPRLPVGIFNKLVAEFCSTLIAKAQQLDRMIDNVNQAQDQDPQRSSDNGPPSLRKESAPNMPTHSAVDASAILADVKEPWEHTKASREPSRKSPGCGSQSVQTCSGSETHRVTHSSLQSRHSIIPAKEARALMREMSVSLHLARDEEEEETAIVKNTPNHALFANLEDMKKHVRNSIMKPYNVAQYYWDDVDVDANGGKATKEKHAFFQIVEWCFFIYFLGEILVRFGAFRSKLNCFRDFWFTFDSLLVMLMGVDDLLPIIFDNGLGFNTSIIRLARLVKLSRMARIAHLLHKYPELNLLLRGIGIGARSVLSSFMLLAVVVYLFAVAFRFLTIDTDVGRAYFRTVPLGMKYLVLTAIMPDAMDMVNTLGDEQVINGCLFVVFITLATLTILNMLIAILCEVVHSAAVLEKETCNIQYVKDHLSHVMEESGFNHHTNEDMFISKGEFQQLLLNKSVVNVMRRLGVDGLGLIEFVEHIFNDDADGSQHPHGPHGLTFEKLVELICALGGSNGVTVQHMIDMRQVVLREIFALEESLESQLHSLQASVSEQIHGLSHEKAPKTKRLASMYRL